jgi:hypothetical protein
MATRLYISNDAAAVTPSPQGGWDDVAAVVTRKLGPKAGASATVAQSETSTSATWDVLLGVWVSDTLSAQTISGTLDWCVGAMESSNNMNANTHLFAWVMKPDGTSRGTLLDTIVASEWLATGTGKAVSGAALSSVGALSGDRIVVELGYQAQNTFNNLWTGTLWYGNAGVTDLTNGNTNVTTQPGWVEFSATLAFGGAVASGRSSQAIFVGL